ncbi:MAG: xylulokinase [Gammaproteobacteria bacterium]|nr:xylulokinase [Gammaproteobacteria bacterium]
MYIGIDIGTQGTKVVVVDSQKKQVIGEGYAEHQIIADEHGKREQQPVWWIQAFHQAFEKAIHIANISPTKIKAIGVSGQQHGLVVLDKDDNVLYNAKLWNDTETFAENNELIEALGGKNKVFERLGIALQTGYTASKIAWLRKHYFAQYSQIAKIMLPHDYINYYLTGEFMTECGDASGTGYFNINTRQWDTDVFQHIAPELDATVVLPKIIGSSEKLGTIKTDIAKKLGLNTDVIVSTGGGDNMMGAIGTGNIAEGVVTMSLGTSGTVYAFTEKPLTLDPAIANFCSSTGGWLPLVCTMNMTSANKSIMDLFQLSIDEFNQQIEKSPIGASGITVLPFFNGERTPNLPQAKASFYGLDSNNFTQENLCRAVIESASFSLIYGLNLLKSAGFKPKEIRLIGGGAKSNLWRQMIADISELPVVTLIESEAAALGAAIQAMWVNHEAELTTLCNDFVQLDKQSTVYPIEENVLAYKPVYQRYIHQLNTYMESNL